jgi:hypothetical protein
MLLFLYPSTFTQWPYRFKNKPGTCGVHGRTPRMNDPLYDHGLPMEHDCKLLEKLLGSCLRRNEHVVLL